MRSWRWALRKSYCTNPAAVEGYYKTRDDLAVMVPRSRREIARVNESRVWYWCIGEALCTCQKCSEINISYRIEKFWGCREYRPSGILCQALGLCGKGTVVALPLSHAPVEFSKLVHWLLLGFQNRADGLFEDHLSTWLREKKLQEVCTILE